MNGYIPPRRTREIEGTFEAAEGAEPFRATIVTSLTFAEIDAIPISGNWGEIFDAIAPYVVAWNVMARNSETGEYEPLPPPADAGADVLRGAPIEVAQYLWGCLKTVHLGDPDERKNASGPSGGMPAGRPESGSDSSRATTKATRRKSRPASA